MRSVTGRKGLENCFCGRNVKETDHLEDLGLDVNMTSHGR